MGEAFEISVWRPHPGKTRQFMEIYVELKTIFLDEGVSEIQVPVHAHSGGSQHRGTWGFLLFARPTRLTRGMQLHHLSAMLASLPGVSEEQPFGPNYDVFKVRGKIVAILSPDESVASISLKCDPGLALELRNEFASVTGGYHLNKRHWNTVILDGSVPDNELRAMVQHSYNRVVAGLTKSARESLATKS